jgi:hypothetical protein
MFGVHVEWCKGVRAERRWAWTCRPMGAAGTGP